LLAAELRGPAAGRLGDWAERNGLRPSSLSRGFRLAYGVSPQRYRAECRASRAAGFIRGGEGSLASIAAAAGFSDQPHMTRMIRAVFGCVPTELARRCDNCVQDGSEAAR
jgi:AraC-like DNA-binding protein